MLVVRGEIWTLFAMFMFYYIIILFQTSSNKYHTNHFAIIKQVHFILIKWNFYDHYFMMFVPFKKKFMLVVREVRMDGNSCSRPINPHTARPVGTVGSDLHSQFIKSDFGFAASSDRPPFPIKFLLVYLISFTKNVGSGEGGS
jgi:hypothetical protein